MTNPTDLWRLMWPAGIPPTDFDKALALIRIAEPVPLPKPTARDEEMLALLREGATVERMAKALSITKQAVNQRLHRLRRDGYRINTERFDGHVGPGRPAQVFKVAA